MAVKSREKVIVVAIGGATCTGKTQLAVRLQRVLGHCLLLHLDDYEKDEPGPLHPVYRIADNEDPPTAFEWTLWRDDVLRLISQAKKKARALARTSGLHTPDKATKVDLLSESWSDRFERIAGDKVFVIIEGRQMFFNEEVNGVIDIPILLRENPDVLKRRRQGRTTYDSNGRVRTESKNYWDRIVWPAYRRAHEGLFTDGDVLEGRLRSDIAFGDRLKLIECQQNDIAELVSMACSTIEAEIAKPKVEVESFRDMAEAVFTMEDLHLEP